MLNLNLAPSPEGLKILCLGAHCDDIEIGCGGTLLRLIDEYTISEVRWVVFTSTQLRASETRESSKAFLKKAIRKEVVVHNFRDGFLFENDAKVKEIFENLKSNFQPDLIFTHYQGDRHQDHRLISDLTWNTFRNHLILEYEIPKYDGDLGNPHFFISLLKTTVEDKCQFLIEHYRSQQGKHWFEKEMFTSLMRIRGMECASKTNYAEAFYARKLSV